MTTPQRIGKSLVGLIPAQFRAALKYRIKAGLKTALKPELKSELKAELGSELKAELAEQKAELKSELKLELKSELKAEVKADVKAEVKSNVKAELETELSEQKAELNSDLKAELNLELKSELKSELKADVFAKLEAELTEQKSELKSELKTEVIAELETELAVQRAGLKSELKSELKAELKGELVSYVSTLFELSARLGVFCQNVGSDLHNSENANLMREHEATLRRIIRQAAGLSPDFPPELTTDDLLQEVTFIHLNAQMLAPAFKALQGRRVLYCGQAYYNNWYLSRELRALGWKADVYNWDGNPSSQIYYHGEDFRIGENVPASVEGELSFYLRSLYEYDVVHFANAHGIAYGGRLQNLFKSNFDEGREIRLLKELGKKIVYSNNGCLDGVSQSAFSKWGPESACAICRWKNEPSVCSDERNLSWGRFRNEVSDYQCTLGGNRADYNDDPRVHEVPEFYCLNPEIWNPNLVVPDKYLLPPLSPNGVRVYHAVGNRNERTRSDGVNIKSSHIYLPLIERLRADGLPIELVAPTGVPNKEVRFLQVQSDIFLEMLTFGWFGANAREAMMLGKPVICFIRPEWLESLRQEIPEYAAELPIISATAETVESVLRDLIASPEKRKEIGARSRNFALKWHTDTVAGKRFDEIYQRLLAGDSLLRKVA